LRSDAAFPWPAFVKVTFLTVCSILFLVGAARAEASRGVPESPGHPARRHTSVELAKVRRAAVSARKRIRYGAGKGRRSRTGAQGVRGQQVISSERAAQIQSALIREHYLDGAPSGVWDQRTKDAMIRYQAENGWQTKITPDSRALIKLGLGPRHDGLLNPDSAALGSPHELGVEREIPGGH
jgi:Putative peptidoglycan binding domain